jgi:hypothetical protein
MSSKVRQLEEFKADSVLAYFMAWRVQLKLAARLALADSRS